MVLTGLQSVGASEAEAASGLLVVSVVMGLGSVLFSWRTRMPVTLAWSTPGAAMLAGAGEPGGGYAAAVGAFAVAALLYLLTGVVRPLGRWVQRIPPSLANAMLAGVLLTLCVEPFRALADDPRAVAPVLITWLVVLWRSRRFATPLAFVAAVAVIVATGSVDGVGATDLVPQLTWTAPHADVAAAVSLGLPLYLVTMTGQNIPGVAVMASLGYRVPLREALFYTGGTGVLTAGLGGYSTNLAAISAALTAGPDGHPDPGRRWPAGIGNGVTSICLGVAAAAVTTIAVAAPDGVLETVAGLALLGTFAASTAAALADPRHREAAAVTFVVAASGYAVGGVGAAFWSLLAGGLVLAVTAPRRSGRPPVDSGA